MTLNYINFLGFLLAYFIGAIPTSVWVGRIFFKIDIREFGSKNAGATNTLRTLGWPAGLFVLFFDIFKGWFAVQLSYYFAQNLYIDIYFQSFQVLLALAAVTGHIFPIYVGFKGGKGVAVLTGVAIALFPNTIIVSLVVFLITFIISKYVSLSSIVSAITFPFISIFIFHLHDWPLIVLSCLIALFIPITHQKNIRRLLAGEERKMLFNKKV